jgi:hypothetical protein
LFLVSRQKRSDDCPLSDICKELEVLSPLFEMEAEKKKIKTDHQKAMWKKGKAPIVPGERVISLVAGTEKDNFKLV